MVGAVSSGFCQAEVQDESQSQSWWMGQSRWRIPCKAQAHRSRSAPLLNIGLLFLGLYFRCFFILAGGNAEVALGPYLRVGSLGTPWSARWGPRQLFDVDSQSGRQEGAVIPRAEGHTLREWPRFCLHQWQCPLSVFRPPLHLGSASIC